VAENQVLLVSEAIFRDFFIEKGLSRRKNFHSYVIKIDLA
jgi:hypothetical protein